MTEKQKKTLHTHITLKFQNYSLPVFFFFMKIL